MIARSSTSWWVLPVKPVRRPLYTAPSFTLAPGWATTQTHLVERPVGEEDREGRQPRDVAQRRQARRHADHVLLGDPHLQEAFGKGGREAVDPRRRSKVGVEDQEIRRSQRPGRRARRPRRPAWRRSRRSRRRGRADRHASEFPPRRLHLDRGRDAGVPFGSAFGEGDPAPLDRPGQDRGGPAGGAGDRRIEAGGRDRGEVVAVDRDDSPAERLERAGQVTARPMGRDGCRGRASPAGSGQPYCWSPLQSTIAVRLPSRYRDATITLSQTMPSCISPSPSMTTVLASRPRIRDPRAIPSPTARPCPREPVEASSPGRRVMSGWPWSRLSPRSKVASSSTGK